ncbi:activating signal cointegrator 1 complex subunit 1 [Drosophila sulfurigaster albostrigata]|uniref:activating signal cointegrator 1 complex subunit 1 n=1 Tax=Drosophila sulfurigaster albostrigata TaxID=89887 RepID=UPI002D21E735|nr:activating signal cointegrator 1 complex subunit 1 [Drosophila sulfurigaster albostrigata]
MSRNVLAPPTQRLSHNRNYRVNVVHDDFGGSKWNSKKQSSTSKGYEEPDLYGEDDYEDDGTECNIEEQPDGSFKLALHVPKSFYGGLIGFKGSTKRRIETESKTTIHVPRQTDVSNDLIIRSNERSNVCSALRKVRLLLDSLRKRMRPTHFLAVPLNSGQVKDRFMELKQKILDAQLPGIDSELFISERCIHLTLGIYVLLDDAERKNAVNELQTCRQWLADLTTPFELKVKGLEIMNDDPSSVRVLYACVESPQLQQFADKCLKHFQTTGLSATDNNTRDNIKLHMTVLNSRYREENNSSFDGREILKRFSDFDFGTAQCNEVHLCVLKSSKEVEDFYKITGSLKF